MQNMHLVQVFQCQSALNQPSNDLPFGKHPTGLFPFLDGGKQISSISKVSNDAEEPVYNE